jgi:hypothetical protein
MYRHETKAEKELKIKRNKQSRKKRNPCTQIRRTNLETFHVEKHSPSHPSIEADPVFETLGFFRVHR